MVTRVNPRVVLINTLITRKGCLGRADKSLALKTVEAGLRARGFKGEVLYFPTHEGHALGSLLADSHSVAGELDALVDSSQKNIIGLSASTENHDVFLRMSRLVRDRYPGEVVVGGGHYFMRQRGLVDSGGVRYRDPIEIALQEGWVDAAIDGHMSPFASLVAEHGGDIDRVDERGFYRMGRDKVVGRGVGAYPQLNQILHIVSDNGAFYEVMFEALCANACRYCCANRGVFGFSEKQVFAFLDAIVKARGREHPAVLDLVDSSPFSLRKTQSGGEWRLLDVLDRFEEDNDLYSNLMKSAFLDPSLLVEMKSDEDLAMFITRLLRQGFLSFFVGRETPSGEISRLIGRNYKGQVRDQARLDAEKIALEKFIGVLKFWRSSKEYPPVQFPSSIKLSYIVSPFETEESMVALLDEAEWLCGLSDERVMVNVDVRPLMPFPGTPIRKDHVDFLVDPERLNLVNPHSNPWSERLGLPAALIDSMLSPAFILASDILARVDSTAGLRILRSLVADVFAGKIVPVKDADKRKHYVVMVDRP